VTAWRRRLLIVHLLSTIRITLGFAPLLYGRRFRYCLYVSQSNKAEADDDAPLEKTKAIEVPLPSASSASSSSWLAGALNKGVFGYEGRIGVRGRGQSSVNNANNAYAAVNKRAALRSMSSSNGRAATERGLKLGPAACMSCVKYVIKKSSDSLADLFAPPMIPRRFGMFLFFLFFVFSVYFFSLLFESNYPGTMTATS